MTAVGATCASPSKFRQPVSEWSSDDVCSWLQEDANMGHVVENFQEQMIDGPALLSLTEDDLQQVLGCNKLGERRSLLSKINSLKLNMEQSNLLPSCGTSPLISRSPRKSSLSTEGAPEEQTFVVDPDRVAQMPGPSHVYANSILSSHRPDVVKRFLFALRIFQYTKLAPQSILVQERCVPQYCLIGGQTSGKTTILSRLAGLPLGYTSGNIGTRRPFEYTLIYDADVLQPDITVDGQRVPESDLFSTLVSKNNRPWIGGFEKQKVSVEIRSNTVTSLVIVDFPGTRESERQPEEMVVDHLQDQSIVPIVVLESGHVGAADYACGVLRRARRSRDEAIAIVTKADEKMDGHGEWTTPDGWTAQWNRTKYAGFKMVFFAGWPYCAERNAEVWYRRKALLRESFAYEEELISKWATNLGTALEPEAREQIGLEKFRQFLRRDQAARLEEIQRSVGPKVRRELDSVSQERIALEDVSAASCTREVISLLDIWVTIGKDVLEGQFDPHKQAKTSLFADLNWLSGNSYLVAELPGSAEHSESTDAILKRLPWMKVMLLAVLPQAHLEMVGKAALERDISLFFFWCWFELGWNMLSDLSEEFIRNVYAKPEEDSGNKVILELKRRMVQKVFHPLVNLLCLLLQKHFEDALTAAFSRASSHSEWLPMYEKYADTELQADYEQQVKHEVATHIAGMCRHLHDTLETQQCDLQGSHRTSEASRMLANNTSGVERASGSKASLALDIYAEEDETSRFNLLFRHFLKLSRRQLWDCGSRGQELALIAEHLASRCGADLCKSSSRYGTRESLESFFEAEAGTFAWVPMKTIRSPFSTEYWFGDGCLMALPGNRCSFDQCNDAHDKAILRSRMIAVTTQTMLQVSVKGGVGVKPSIAGEVAAVSGRTDSAGFLGVALRDAESNRWLLSKRRWRSGWETEVICFSQAELSPFDGRTVTIDIVDTHCEEGFRWSRGWGWLGLVEVEISGCSLWSEPGGMAINSQGSQQPLQAISDVVEEPEPALSSARKTALEFLFDVGELSGKPQLQCGVGQTQALQLALLPSQEEQPLAKSGSAQRTIATKAIASYAEKHLQQLRREFQMPHNSRLDAGLDFSVLFDHAAHELLEQLALFRDTLAANVSRVRKTISKTIACNVHCHFHEHVPAYVQRQAKHQREVLKAARRREQLLHSAQELLVQLEVKSAGLEDSE